MEIGHMVSKKFWGNINRSTTGYEMLEIEPRANGQSLWSTTDEQRMLPVDASKRTHSARHGTEVGNRDLRSPE